jgi:hypothetical protein
LRFHAENHTSEPDRAIPVVFHDRVAR